MVNALEGAVEIEIRQVFGKPRGFVKTIRKNITFECVEETDKDWDGEFIVNSKGIYVYTCYNCNIPNTGSLGSINLNSPRIVCGICNYDIDAGSFSGEGPRVYMITKLAKK